VLSLYEAQMSALANFESTEEAFCCPDFRVTTRALCIDPRFVKLIRGSWFAKVVVMSERTTAQIRLLFSHQAHRSIAYLIPPIDPIENP